MSTDDTTIDQPDDDAPSSGDSRPEAPEPASASSPSASATSATEPSLAWSLSAAALASIGAGVIHATATGSHNEHRQAAVTFAVLTALQVGWGVLALVRPWRRLSLLAFSGIALNAAAVAGWALAKTSGIGFIDGLDQAEGVQFPDAAAAVLAAVAAIGALIVVAPRISWARQSQPVLVGCAALATLALVVPGMVTAGNHDHAHGEGGDEHDMAGMDHSEHDMEAAGNSEHDMGDMSAAVPARPYDATLPVDLSGVPGVSRQEQHEAEELVTRTIERLPQFADYREAERLGYRSIGDGATGFEHFNNWRMIDDEYTLDPDHPESLVFRVNGDQKELVAVMFLLNPEDTLETVPDIGGELIQWHIHNDLCYYGETYEWKVGDVAPPGTDCRPGTFRFPYNVPMAHVWIVPHVCGPFAALEGVGGGQIAEGEERACDHAHGAAEGTPGAVTSENGDLASAVEGG